MSNKSSRGSSIGWEPRLMKRRSLVRISHLSLVWTCKKKKIMSKNKQGVNHSYRSSLEFVLDSIFKTELKVNTEYMGPNGR